MMKQLLEKQKVALAGSALLLSSFSFCAPGCKDSSNPPQLPHAMTLFPKTLPNAVTQADQFIARIEAAKLSGKPVVALLKVYHQTEEGSDPRVEEQAPGFNELIGNLIAESQFEALWLYLKFDGARLAVAEGAADVEGVGELGEITQRASSYLITHHFPNGIPHRFQELTPEQKKILTDIDAPAVAFALRRIDKLYPAGDPRELDRIDRERKVLEERYGGVPKTPWPPEYHDLVFRRREEALAAYLPKLAALPENSGKVILLTYGTLHFDIPMRLRKAGFEVVELDCGGVFDSFRKELKKSAKGAK